MVQLFFAALLLLGLPDLTLANSRTEIYRHTKAATVLIVAINDTNHSVSLGSGFFVGPDGLIVTNAHVIEDHTRLFVYVQDQEVYPAPYVVTVDADLDLAALRLQLKDKEGGTLALATRTAEDGQEIIAVGYPRITDILQMGFVLHPTIISAHVNGLAHGRSRLKGQSTPFIQTTGNFNFGNSGGPVVNLDTNEVVGMVVHTVPYLERAKDRNGTSIGSVTMKSGIGYLIPATVIRQWLSANKLTPVSSGSNSDAMTQTADAVQDGNRSFATGHLLHTIAMVLQQDTDLLSLAAYHYERAAALRPDATWVTRNLGLVSASLGRWEQALHAYLKALDQNPKDAALLTDAGLAFEKTGNRERAIEAYRAAILANSRSDLAHNNLGILFLKMGRIDEAIQEFRSALASDPGSAVASYNLGLAFEAKGLRDDALIAWESYLLKPGSGDTAGFNTKMREAVARLKPLTAKAHPVSGGSSK
jgi:Flp pilus assembly protein TadD